MPTDRRSSRIGTTASSDPRSTALERLKALRDGTVQKTPEIKLAEPIYDSLPEDEYARLVAERKASAKEFIVDDNGLGYGDEGEEEDWGKDQLPPSSDEEDEGFQRKRGLVSEKRKKEKREKDEAKQSSSFSAAAALMGKQRLTSMFTSNVLKKREEKGGVRGVSAEAIIEDVLMEFAPDETDRERRRRRLGTKASLPSSDAMLRPVECETVSINKNSKSGIDKLPLVSSMVLGNERLGPDTDDTGMSMDTHAETSPHLEPELASGANDCQDPDASHNNLLREGPIVEKGKVGLLVSERNAKIEKGTVEDKVLLNAKVNIESNSMPTATAGWQAVSQGEKVNGGQNGEVSELPVNYEEKTEFSLDPDGSLPFYIIDAYEEIYGANVGTLYLFGKVKSGDAYLSCCVVVKNLLRCVYAIPTGSVFKGNAVAELESALKDSRITHTTFRTKLQDMATGLKNELSKRLLDLNVSTFSMTPVKRSYAFEQSGVPIGKHYVLKISYPYKDSPLPSDLRGGHFSALFGTNTSALELFLVKRKIKGPCWLTISKFSSCPALQRVSWCKMEVVVDCPKDVNIATSSGAAREIPTVTTAAINLKTVINQQKNMNEVVCASIVCYRNVKIDSPSEWKRPDSHFTVIRKLDGDVFPLGFTKEADERNKKAGNIVLVCEGSERALLNRFMTELHKLDSDVLVGHNISGFDLDVLLHRAQDCKVPSNMWSKLGRLKRSSMPKLTKGNNLFGSGTSPGVLSCISGRLLCDTYLASRDLLKEVSYSLTQLAKTQLRKDRKEIAPLDIPLMFQTANSLLELVECGETDAWLSLGLMFHLSVLPLTRQLTNISGNLWGKTLQGARAQRVEYLLLHAFHSKKYIVPDKAIHKKITSTKRRMAGGAEEGDLNDPNVDDYNFDGDDQHNDKEKRKKGPAYSGGLVLEPKKGLYDKYILLLDFNSLYPSIIQEYNICFTTVERTSDGSIPSLPSSRTTGVLPELLKNLVERRRNVKSWIKKTSNIYKIQQLDIQQQALKLTANSMYGCLGFSNSRFYAKPLAELITLQGREILQSTVDLVQNNLNLEVIYGDTDSIMIHSGLDDISEAKAIAVKVIKEVNKKYRCLEIDLDGLYKRMLLLKKKKYAAVKVLFNKDGSLYEVIERKGLDIVRRDWSLLAKELGDFCLNHILSGGSCEDVVEAIHGHLMKVQEEMRNGEVELDKYVITKSLTKPPEDYADARNQPHVQVALRLKQSGHRIGCSAGDTVPYIICCQPGSGSGSSAGIAQRARHPDELKRDNEDWMVDIEYYLSQQIHPVVSRLCATIQGTSPSRLADCLGIESSKFQHKIDESVNRDSSSLLLCTADDEDRYRGCEPLWISCPSCSASFECPTVSSLITALASQKKTESQTQEEPGGNFWLRLRCSRCPDEGDGSRISPAMIANQVKRQAEKFISKYYDGLMMCDDEMCKHTTRTLNLRVIGESERGTVCPNFPRCNGHLIKEVLNFNSFCLQYAMLLFWHNTINFLPFNYGDLCLLYCLKKQYTEAELYRQLSYYCHVLDSARFIGKLQLEYSMRIAIEKHLASIRPLVEPASSTIQRIRESCAYGWVRFKDLCVSV
ncbi:hypothetical protein AMTRI_Chr11g99120 [Amborella trichopoda]